jgi:4-hydroxyproline epimerase
MSRRLDPIWVIDTHTAGEPTRVVVSGGPDLGSGLLPDRVRVFRDRFDEFRSAVVNEPRGSDVMVGALLCEPSDPSCATGVIYFNNVGYLGMCGHGTIGVAVALGHLGRISTGIHSFETAVGVVAVNRQSTNVVEIENVPSRRSAKNVRVNVPGIGAVVGDVAWGGNWFFLVKLHDERLHLENADRLTEMTWRIRLALAAEGIRGDDGGEIDHIELFGPPTVEAADSKNFVLCPGKAYD